MKTLKNGLFALIFLSVILTPAVRAAEVFSAGSAKTEITPPAGTPLAGYGRRHGKPSEGVHDPLYARALALSKEGRVFILVSADLVLIDEELRRAALKKINGVLPLEENQFLLCATHTHSGAGAVGGRLWQRFIMGKHRKKVFDEVTSKIARAAEEAVKNLQPARALYAETRIDELIENRIDENKKDPHFLKMIRFENPEHEVLGAFILMAAHPTLLPASNYQLSADFPGALAEILDKKFPGSTHVFINGAAGDLRPKAPAIENRFEKMNAYAGQLEQKIQAMDLEEINFDGPWQSISENKKLPAVKAKAGFLPIPSLIGGRVFPRHAVFQGMRFGNYLFLSFPGELSSQIGTDIERGARALGFESFLAGYAQDYIGYVVPRAYYSDSKQYESRASFYGPKMDWFTEKTTREIILKLMTEEEKKWANPEGKLTYKQKLPVLNLSGDSYHIGFEEGRLMKKEIRQGYDEIFAYFRSQLPLPLLNRVAINILADRAWKQMEPYVSYEEYLQLKGLSDGSGISMKKIKQIHALPEIYPALCANSAFWNSATADGRLIAIRNLDWNRQMGIHRRAAVKWIAVPGQKAYANIGYYGFTGVLSGMNENGLSVGQIGADSSDETMKGVPMPFLLRRVLAKADSLENAEQIVRENFRTRGYNYLFTDGRAKKAAVLETTQHHVAVFKDDDPEEKKVPYSFCLKDAVFRGDPALDPQIRDLQKASGGEPGKKGLETPVGSAYEIRYLKQGELLRDSFGKLNPDIARKIALEIAPGSNIQSVIYAYPEFWVANAEDSKRAAETEYIKFNLSEFKKQTGDR